MKTKNLVISGIILIAIIAVILLTEKLGSGKSSGKSKLFFPGFSKTNISAFKISDSKNNIKIQRKGDRWIIASTSEDKAKKQIEGKEEEGTSIIEKAEEKDKAAAVEKEPALNPLDNFPADSASIETVLEKLGIMKKDEHISQNPEKQSLFEVDSTKGTRVEVWDSKNKLIGSFLIGKSGPDWSSHYVRTLGTDDVYSVSGSIKYSFFTDENRWRDKTVIKFDKSLAKKITITKKDTATAESSTIVLEKSLDSISVATWNITTPEKYEADSAAVAKMVNDLSNLKTSKFEENYDREDSDMGFDSPDLVVMVDLDNGDQKGFVVGKKQPDKSEKWVRANDNDVIFLMYESKFNNCTKSLEELKKKEEEKKEEEEKEEEKKEESTTSE